MPDRNADQYLAQEAAPGAPDEQDMLELMREHLSSVSAGDVVAEAAVPLVTLAYVRLGIPPEQHEQYRDVDAARLLIDALRGLLDAVQGRLGAVEPQLRQALAGLQLAFADVAAHHGAGHTAGDAAATPGAQPGAGAAGGEPARPAGESRPSPGSRRPSGLWVPGQD